MDTNPTHPPADHLVELLHAFGDQASSFTCAEMDIIVGWYRAAGLTQEADELMAMHIDGDDADDPHRVESAN